MLPARYAGACQLKDCEYITFVDSDDWIEPDTFELSIEYLQKEIDIITYKIIRFYNEDYSYISEHGFESKLYHRKEIEECILPNMLWNKETNNFGLDPSVCNKIVKYELIMKELEKLKNAIFNYGQDVAITYPLMKNAQSIVFLDTAKYYHRQRERGIIADYLLDKNYFKKLFALYEYLTSELEEEKIVEQIDLFYVKSSQYYLKKYGDEKNNIECLVPFDLLEPHKKIVLYGTSMVGKAYYAQINKINYGEIVAWADINEGCVGTIKIICPEEIANITEYDYVLIAVKMEKTAMVIKQKLISIGVPKERIVWRS